MDLTGFEWVVHVPEPVAAATVDIPAGSSQPAGAVSAVPLASGSSPVRPPGGSDAFSSP